MATQAHTRTSWGALASIILAVAIGSAPVVTILAFQQPTAAVGWEL